jgi:cold-inducible RNA-binding protein
VTLPPAVLHVDDQPEDVPAAPARRMASMKLYVGNLSYDTNETELRELFTPFGEPDTARVITDRDTGRSKGFGFVEFADNAQANAAMSALNGKEVNGRALTVNEARPRNESSSGGGFRGGRGRY